MERSRESKPKSRRWCSVPQCKSRDYPSLHKFPRNLDLRRKWAIACKIGKNVTEWMLVCRNHFTDSDFIPRWDGRLRRLKKIAIPSQNLPVRPNDKILTPEQRMKLENRANRAAKRLDRADKRDAVPQMTNQTSDNVKIPLKDSIAIPKNEILSIRGVLYV